MDILEWKQCLLKCYCFLLLFDFISLLSAIEWGCYIKDIEKTQFRIEHLKKDK